jgi:hypothetical protein
VEPAPATGQQAPRECLCNPQGPCSTTVQNREPTMNGIKHLLLAAWTALSAGGIAPVATKDELVGHWICHAVHCCPTSRLSNITIGFGGPLSPPCRKNQPGLVSARSCRGPGLTKTSAASASRAMRKVMLQSLALALGHWAGRNHCPLARRKAAAPEFASCLGIGIREFLGPAQLQACTRLDLPLGA